MLTSLQQIIRFLLQKLVAKLPYKIKLRGTRKILPNTIRWDILQPNRACKLDSLENSNIEKLSTLNQQMGKILLVLVVVILLQNLCPFVFSLC
jgi:hypothetical protein